MNKKFAITVARQYGSGGREIGNAIADILGIKAYDKELITMAAQKSGMSTDVLTGADEKATNSLLYTLALGSSAYSASAFNYSVPINDKLFITQSEIIREAAQNDSCVIIGRCGDYVLRNTGNKIRIFIYAPVEERMKRISIRHPDLSEKEARDLVTKTDKRRINYYNYYTGKKWGSIENYDIMIDSSCLGIPATAEYLAELIRKKFMTE